MLEDVKSIDFDVNNRFLILISSLSLVIFNIEKKEFSQYELDDQSYQIIEAVRLISTDNDNYSCMIATLRRKIK